MMQKVIKVAQIALIQRSLWNLSSLSLLAKTSFQQLKHMQVEGDMHRTG